MICPQTKAECKFGCDSLESCQLQLAPYEFCDAVTIGSNGEVVTDPCVTSFRVQPTPSGWSLESVAIQKPPKPTMKSKEVEIDGKNVTICWDDAAIIDMNVKPSVEVDGGVPPFVVRDLTKPTLEDIERLVDELEEARSIGILTLQREARAALMAAIRAYVEG